jgi:tetratricopeptide (TPR) repeat protein
MAWCKSGGFYPMAYYSHNLHFLWSSESFEGRSAASLATAKKLGGQISPDVARQVPPAHEIFAVRYFAPVRFGKWDQVLAEPAPPDDLRYALGMYHWARGMALAATGKLDEAAAEQTALAGIAGEDAVKKLEFLEGTAAQLLEVATHMLAGEIAAKRQSFDVALAELEAAHAAEYALRYTEPPAWPLPVRQYQGALLLELGRAAEAEAAFRDDLSDYPENGWSLYGLAQSLRAQKKPAAEAEAHFAAAWAAADITPESSRL